MEKTMKVTIGDKTVVVSDYHKEEAIRNILIFGVENERKAVLSKYDNRKIKLKKKTLSRIRKVVRRERAYWTSNEVELLKRMALRGTSVSEMTVLLKKKYYNISNKLRGLGLQEEHKKAREYRKDEENRNVDSKELDNTSRKNIEENYNFLSLQ